MISLEAQEEESALKSEVSLGAQGGRKSQELLNKEQESIKLC